MEIIEHPYHTEDEIRIAGRTITLSSREKEPIPRQVVEEAVAEMRVPISVLEPVTFHLLRQGFGPMGQHLTQGDESHVILGPSFDTKRDYSTPIHELGHAFAHRYILDTEHYDRYKNLRGNEKITEAIADDFRFIFGGSKATQDPHKVHYRTAPGIYDKVETIFLQAMFVKMLRIRPFTMVFWIGRKDYLVNGRRKLMDVAPFLKDRRTFGPFRFIAQELGQALGLPIEVGWEDGNKQVTIKGG